MKICEEVNVEEKKDGVKIIVKDEMSGRTSSVYLEDDVLEEIYNKRRVNNEY